ncbi:MAG: PKD domain-containing protein [Bryobacteraceae bacterium]|nr:PKD domain-containing protein [Bryobacteraceae bacterium]
MPLLAQTNDLTISNYRFLPGERRISTTVYEYDLQADLTNTGLPRGTVTATITSAAANITPLQGVLRFGPVGTNATVTSLNSITLRVDRALPFELNTIIWNFSTARSPVAVAGPNQTVALGATVYLNGSGSTSPAGSGGLTYSWAFTQRPLGSTAVLANPTSVNPTFVTDFPGLYIARLTVTNLGGSDSSTVTISTGNSIPVANPGPNQSVGVTTLVQLDGSRSSDVNGDPLTYLWSFSSRPSGSNATLTNPRLVNPQFRVDRAGTYVLRLVVNDGRFDSSPEFVTISTRNTAPVANPGAAQSVTLNSTVQLTGAGSTDVDGDPLTYLWSFNSIPSGSAAAFSSTTAVNPTFTVDRPGTYVAQLIVNDGALNSTPVTVTISTNAIQPPTANPGPNQSVQQGATVSLTASGTDPQNQPLTYTWSFASRAANSAAVLTNPTTATPTFIADKPGTFVLQLIANNGFLNSTPVTMQVTTTGTAPVANAGAAQNVNLGSVVTLNGTASSDADNDPLTYSWSLTSVPANSTAVLTGPTSARPTFVADRLGTYVAQLIVNDGFYNSAPVTVTIQAGATLTFDPTSLTFDDRGPGSFTLTLSAPAPAGGLTVNLISTNTSVVTVPATVSFAQNARTATFAVTPVTPGGTSVIRANLLPDVPTASANVTLNFQDIVLPNNVIVAPAGQAAFNISLANAPAAPVTVLLQIDNPVRASLTLTSVTFNAGQTQPVAQPRLNGLSGGPIQITATATGLNTAVTNATVTGSVAGAIVLPTTATMTQGQQLPYPVSITGPAPAGGLTVNLSSDTAASITVTPASVTIPAGQTQATVVPTLQASALGQATISASASGVDTVTRVIQVVSPTGPVANAGSAQTVAPNTLVSLSGSGTDPQQLTLTYQWSLPVKPAGSASTLTATTAAASFTADIPGTYQARLVVNNGFVSSAPSTVTITVPLPPTALPGTTLTTSANAAVTLNGSGTDPQSLPLTYAWTLSSRPSGSAATLSSTLARPSFTPDLTGEYIAQLIVSNGFTSSQPATVRVVVPLAPTAIPGAAQTVSLNTLVNLTGSGTDPQSLPLTYAWTFQSRPNGSNASLASQGANATFTPDVTGQYVAQLVVNNGFTSSAPATVTISVPLLPVAIPGNTQTVRPNTLVTLNGSGTDPQSLPLTYAWTLQSKPSGSNATLNSTSASTTFTPDVPGEFVARLVVNNGFTSSLPATVRIVVPLPATANPGSPQTVRPNTAVNLTGSGTDPQSLPLTYSWSLQSKPSGSNATLNSQTANAVFTPDIPGSYVAQLIVDNTFVPSAPATVTILVPLAPTALPGTTQTVGQGFPVTLNGSGTDPQSLPLTYAWTLSSRPAGSAAVLSSTQASPVFNPDILGVYVAQLIVSNGFTSSAPATVTINVGLRGALSLPSSVSFALGSQTPIVLSLSTPAPAGGVTVLLTSSDPSLIQVIPQSVSIPAGATAPSSSPIVQGVNLGTATVTATALGYSTAAVVARSTASISFNQIGLTFIDPTPQTISLILSSQAPATGLTVNLTSTNPSVATVPATASFAPGSSIAQVSVTGVAPGTATLRASSALLAETTANITYNSPDIALPVRPVVAVDEVATFPVTLQRPSQGTTFVQLEVADPSKASLSITNVVFQEGQTTPLSQPRLTGRALGTTLITATAIGLSTNRTTVRVGLGMSFAAPTVAITGTATENLALNLSAPAPVGGLTINLATTNPAVATVPATVFFGQGAVTLNVPITGVGAGSTTLTATSSVAGDAAAGVVVTAAAGAGSLILPAAASLTPGQTVPFPVSLSSPAGPNGLTVTLASNSGAVTILPLSVTVAAGQTQAAPVPQLTAVSLGSADISATAPGYSSATRTITVQTAPPASVVVSSGSGQSANTGTTFPSALVALVRDAQLNPVAGVTVTFAVPGSGASATLSSLTAITNGAGLASSPQPVANATAGSYSVTASVNGVATPASFALTNVAVVVPPPSGGPNSLVLAPVTVGRNLQTQMTLTLPQAAGPGGQRVTVTSNNSLQVLVSGRVGDPGSNQITFNVGEGLTSSTFFVHGLAASGTPTVTATVSGGANFDPGTGTVTLAPSGFVLTSPNSPNSQAFSLGQGSSATLTVTAARLNSSLNFVEAQQVRGGQSVQVTLTNSTPATGSVSPAAVTLAGGTSTATSSFTANGVSIGATTLTAVVPANFSQPAAGANILTPTVILASLSASPVSVGENLQTTTTIRLNAPAPDPGVTVTLLSDDAGKVVFATSPTAAGTGTLVINIPAGRTASAPFYVQGLANSGVVNFTATSSLGSTVGSVTLFRSAFVLQGPFGVGSDFFTTTGAPPTSLTVLATRLDASGFSIEPLPIRGGLSVDVNVTSGSASVGTMSSVPVRLNGGDSSGTAVFTPASAGASVLNVPVPQGFSAPASGSSLTATVRLPGIVLIDNDTVGNNLQLSGSLSLGQPAPAGGTAVTLTSNSPSLLLSATATGAGSNSITVTVSEGQFGAPYYLQGKASSGSATYSAAAQGFAPKSATINLAPSGLILSGPFGVGFNFSLSLAGGPRAVNITTALLDPGTNSVVMTQPLAGGASLTIPVGNNSPNFASTPASVVLLPGASSVDVPVTPVAVGATLLNVSTTLPGFSPPRSGVSLVVQVTN